MDRNQYLTAIVALACIVGLGFSAAAIESSLSTHPDDVIDLDYAYLPFGEDDVQSVKLEAWDHAGEQVSPAENQDDRSDLQSGDGDEDTPTPTDTPSSSAGREDGESGGDDDGRTQTDSGTRTPTAQSDETDETDDQDGNSSDAEVAPADAADEENESEDARGGNVSEEDVAGGEDRDGEAETGDDESGGNNESDGVGMESGGAGPAGVGQGEGSCFGSGLISSLNGVLPWHTDPCGPLLPYLLAVFLLAGLLALGYRYRDRIPGYPSGVGEPVHDGPQQTDPGEPISWPSETPPNDIYSAWLTMVQRANPERLWTRTPAECALIAVEQGLDSEAVETITRIFEEVRYAGAPVTEARQQKARDGLQRLEESGGP